MKRDNKITISDVRFTGTSSCETKNGLLGFVSCILNDSFHLDGIAVRCTRRNRLTLAYPFCRDSSGRQHHYLRPLTDEVRREIENQIFQILGIKEDTV